VGQGTGGTLGPKAQGSTTFQVRFSEDGFGVHCADTNNLRKCLRQRSPRIGSLFSGNGAVFQDGARVGRAHFTSIVTQRGRNADALFLVSVRLDDGTLSLQGVSGDEDVTTSAITGGTGAYAGARGYSREESVSDDRVNVTLTFIP